MNRTQMKGTEDVRNYVFKVTANEIKEIVALLNRPPFDENFTMVR